MTYKKYIIFFILAIMLFSCVNLIIWQYATQYLLSDKFGFGGELSRIGYIVDSRQPRMPINDLPARHLEFRDYSTQQVDVLTVGDSFSHGGAGGKNRYYQDYIAAIQNASVLNLARFNFEEGSINTVITLLNSGYIDRIKPKYILLQSVERVCLERFADNVDFSHNMSTKDIDRYYSEHTQFLYPVPATSFINTANIKYLYYRIRYLFSDSPTRNVITAKLTKPFFNVKNEKMLLFFRDDINNIAKFNKGKVPTLNSNLNRLSRMLDVKGIKLYFMPIVDKYNLYSTFIENNKYPSSFFFEELRLLPKEYTLIDSKAILLDALKRGEKDIFYADDTHWSWRASEIIFNRVRFE